MGENRMLFKYLRTVHPSGVRDPVLPFQSCSPSQSPLFCHGTGRWHKTRPQFWDKDRWGLSTTSPVNSFSAATTGNIFLSFPGMSYSGNHYKWDFAELSVWTRKPRWEIVPPFWLFTFLLHPHFLNLSKKKRKKNVLHHGFKNQVSEDIIPF